MIYRTNENHFKLIKEKNSIVLIEDFKGEKTEIAREPYKENDVFWCTADIGWITGHSYIIYGPLFVEFC